MGSVQAGMGLERGDKVTRLEAFVDAAFAFAVTLLVIFGNKCRRYFKPLPSATVRWPWSWSCCLHAH